MGAVGTIDVKCVEKYGHHAPAQGVVIAIAVHLGQMPEEGQNLRLTRARIRRADFDRNQSLEHLVSREPDRGIAAVAELLQYMVMTAKSITDGHGMVATRAISVKRLRVVNSMEVDLRVRFRRATPIWGLCCWFAHDAT